MPPGAEGRPGIDEQRRLAARRRPLDMAAAEIEPPGADRRQGLGLSATQSRAGRSVKAGLPQAAKAARIAPRSGAPAISASTSQSPPRRDLEAREREREGLQHRLRRSGRPRAKPQPHRPEDRRWLPHEACSAGTTKPAITFLVPALSKSMSSLSPSAAITSP